MRTTKLASLALALAVMGCEGKQQQQQPEEGGVQQVGGEAEEKQDGVLGGEQQEQEPAPEGEQAGQPEEMGRADQPTGTQQQQTTARGTVKEVDFGQGKLTLDTGTGTLELRARPFEMRQLVPGDVVQVSYGSFGEESWVMPTGDWQADVSSYGQQTTLTGTIEKVDRNAGTVTVRGETLHAHPAQLENMVQGQFVQATFVRIDNMPWISTIQPMAGEEQGT